MKPRIRIRLFDRLSVLCGDRELLVHSSANAKEILCYLIVNRRGSVTRDALAALIAPSLPHAKSKKALRHALWQLRVGLSLTRCECSPRLLSFGPGWAQFTPDEQVSVDTDDLERLSSSAKNLEDNTPIHPSALSKAVETYRGDFLQGWEQHWCELERQRLRQIYLEVLDALVGYCESHNHVGAGVGYATNALGIDPAREGSHRSLMRLYALTGDRTSALNQYRGCVEALRELGLCPDADTNALEQQIRAGRTSDSTDQMGQPTESLGPEPRIARRARSRLRQPRETFE